MAIVVRKILPLVVVLIALVVAGCSSQDATTQHVSLAGKSFVLELALDSTTRHQGLSDRKSIDASGGMLFVFTAPEVSEFVMRKCYVPIDIVFLDPSGRVVQMCEMAVEPYDTPEEKLVRYSSRWPAQFAIELRGGTIRTLNLKEGQLVELPVRELIRRAR